MSSKTATTQSLLLNIIGRLRPLSCAKWNLGSVFKYKLPIIVSLSL